MKFSHLVEYNMRDIFFEKSYIKGAEERPSKKPRLFSVK